MTRAPSRASPVAMANPMPLVEPETRAVLSVSFRFIFCLKPLLMPRVDFLFGLKPVAQVASVSAATLLPDLMRALGDLFFQAQVLVHLESRHGGFMCRFGFHSAISFQNAKHSQPNPKN